MSDGILQTALPWLDADFARLWQAHRSDRLGHAFLITGPKGLGKRQFAHRLAAALHCADPGPDGIPCGTCADCQLHATEGHPDWTLIHPDPEAKSPEIKVEAIRDLCSHQTLTATRRGPSVIAIAPAEVMNLFAANSLLKTLEEPTASTLLLLISEDPSRLPATIRSRCQQLTIGLPDEQQALTWLGAQPAIQAQLAKASTPPQETLLHWLRLAHGAPLAALELADSDRLAKRSQVLAGLVAVAAGHQDPIVCAASWKALEMAPLLDWLASGVSDLLRLSQAGPDMRLDNPDQQESLVRLATQIDPRSGHRFLRQVIALKAKPLASLNRELVCETLALNWALMTRDQDQSLNKAR